MKADSVAIERLRLIGTEMFRLADKQSESVGHLFALEHHNTNTTREIAIVARRIAKIRPSINRHDERLARSERRPSLTDA